MKHSIYHYFGILALALLLTACGNQNKKDVDKPASKDQTTVKTDHEVIFENDYAKVLKLSLAPGESQPTHDGENRLIYALTDYSIDWEEQGTKLGTKTWEKGDIHFHTAGKHSATNNGTTTAEWIVFSKKNTNLPECGENIIEKDVNSVSPDFAEILFQNDHFRVTRVNLPSGKSIPRHNGINRIIYSLNDYGLNYKSGNEDMIYKKFNVGDIHWHEACQHSLENSGETEAKFLVVSYKSKNN